MMFGFTPYTTYELRSDGHWWFSDDGGRIWRKGAKSS